MLPLPLNPNVPVELDPALTVPVLASTSSRITSSKSSSKTSDDGVSIGSGSSSNIDKVDSSEDLRLRDDRSSASMAFFYNVNTPCVKVWNGN